MMNIEEINDQTRFDESRTNMHAYWGSHLGLPEYLELENLLKKNLTLDGLKFRVYGIILNDTLVASCDVLTRPLYSTYKGQLTEHCIGKVFVKPEMRHQKLAHTLLTQVVEQLGDQKVTLFSDIGDFYSQFGFKFPLDVPGESYLPRYFISAITAKNRQPQCELLNANHVFNQVVNEHIRLLRRLQDDLQSECGEAVHFVHVLPHKALYNRLVTRSIKTAEYLNLKIPKYFGARTPNGHGWITWAYFFEERKLKVLGAFGSVNEIAELLVKAVQLGSEYKLEVELWQSSIINLELLDDEIVGAITAHDLTIREETAKDALPMHTSEGTWLRPGFYAWF